MRRLLALLIGVKVLIILKVLVIVEVARVVHKYLIPILVEISLD